MKEIVIVDGVRTAIGRVGGTLARFRPEELGALAIRGLMDKTGIDPNMIEDVVMGLSNSWHAAYNPSRWAVLKAGLPYSVPGVTVERQCSSGLEAWKAGVRRPGCCRARIPPIRLRRRKSSAAKPHPIPKTLWLWASQQKILSKNIS